MYQKQQHQILEERHKLSTSTCRLIDRDHLKDHNGHQTPHGIRPIFIQQPQHGTKYLKDGQRRHHLLL